MNVVKLKRVHKLMLISMIYMRFPYQPKQNFTSNYNNFIINMLQDLIKKLKVLNEKRGINQR